MKDDTRVSIKTYVPAYQREEWEAHAEELEMSLSEFVRTMVQAGRRGFEDTHPEPVTPRGNGLESTLQNRLRKGPANFGDLQEEIKDDIEECLMEMRNDGTVDQDIEGNFVLEES